MGGSTNGHEWARIIGKVIDGQVDQDCGGRGDAGGPATDREKGEEPVAEERGERFLWVTRCMRVQ